MRISFKIINESTKTESWQGKTESSLSSSFQWRGSRNEVAWVNHIISIHSVRCKFMVLKFSLNANTRARISTLLKNQILAMSARTEIGLVKTVLVESSYIFKSDLLCHRTLVSLSHFVAAQKSRNKEVTTLPRCPFCTHSMGTEEEKVLQTCLTNTML